MLLFLIVPIISSLLGILIPQKVQAAPTPILYDGIDITDAVLFFKKHVLILNHPTLFFHWNSHGELGDGEVAQENVRKMAEYYWRSYGDVRGITGTLGNGFYFSIDPVATWEYGGSTADVPELPWNYQLVQIKLPIGTQILDVSNFPQIADVQSSKEELPDTTAANNVFLQFSCPLVVYSNENTANLTPFFVNGGARLPDSCQRLIKKITRNILNIDALLYDYRSTRFSFCDSESTDYKKSIVIVNPKNLSYENVTIFNEDSIHSTEDRLSIQSLFLAAVSENSDALLGEGRGFISLITQSEAESDARERTSREPYVPARLLWRNLEGQSKIKNLGNWAHQNILYCAPSSGLLSAKDQLKGAK